MRESRTYDVEYDIAYEVAIEVAREIYNIKRKSKNRGIISCGTKASIWSWGEDVEIHIEKVDTQTTKVTVDSSPSAQLIDWGKSSDNIEDFFELFEEELGD